MSDYERELVGGVKNRVSRRDEQEDMATSRRKSANEEDMALKYVCVSCSLRRWPLLAFVAPRY